MGVFGIAVVFVVGVVGDGGRVVDDVVSVVVGGVLVDLVGVVNLVVVLICVDAKARLFVGDPSEELVGRYVDEEATFVAGE